jgi:hypothetical protein
MRLEFVTPSSEFSDLICGSLALSLRSTRVYRRHIISHIQISCLPLTIDYHKALTLILKISPTTMISIFTSSVNKALEFSYRCKYTAPIVFRIGQTLQDIVTDLCVRDDGNGFNGRHRAANSSNGATPAAQKFRRSLRIHPDRAHSEEDRRLTVVVYKLSFCATYNAAVQHVSLRRW